ncbi:hypothetical protein [Prevotella communis]|nr:hypothetical protein [Prevotella communis]
MKEDQTQLITARLEHLQFMMENGKMPIFRHRSDMFLFAMEAYNIARGLSSRYYRLQEDLDIRFFVRFQFDYWLEQIQKWIEELGCDEYRVKAENFFAEGRAKRLTIVVNKLFKYHEDKLPEDSVQGSIALPDEEILDPFKAILSMESVDMAVSFRDALREVHTNLLKLSMVPVVWPEEKRREALQGYLNDSMQTAQVQTEITNYKYFCGMPDGKSVKSQFCYLKQRLFALTANGELGQLSVAKSEQNEFLVKLGGLFGKDETNPTAEQIASNAKPMADENLFGKFLYFVQIEGVNSFPVLNEDKVSNYLIRKDVFLTEKQELNLQALFALMGAMKEWFAPIVDKRLSGSSHGAKMQERVNVVMGYVREYNSKLSSLLEFKREVSEIDAFFDSLFSPMWREEYGKGQDELLGLFEKGLNGIKLEPYVHMLREAQNTLEVFKRETALGRKIFKCLEGTDIVYDANEDTVYSYFSKVDYKNTVKWKKAIALVEAVEKEYKQDN